MLIKTKHCGYIAGIRLYPGGGKGGGQQDANIGNALVKQSETADKMSDFVMQSYKDNQPMLEKLQKLNGQVIEQNMGLATKAGERADDAYNFYTNIGRPVVQKSIQESNNWDRQENIDAARARAGADVQSASDNAQAQQQRGLQRMGINPNSGKMLALNNQRAIQKAGVLAGAQNNAGEQRRTQAVGLRTQSANLANGFAGQSMGQAGQAGGFGTSAAGVGGANLGQNMSVQNQATSGMQAVGGMYGNNASGYQNLGNAQDERSAQAAAGMGQLVGIGASMSRFMADGGKVNGPGSGTSDSVKAVNTDNAQPIRLSNGEYIVSADVVKAKGQEFFDKLQERYHRPVNLGRA